MPTLAELTENDLANPQVFEQVKNAYLDCAEHLLIPESRRFTDLLESKIGATLQASNPEFYLKYQQMIVLLRFISLVTLDKNTLLKLFQFHTLDALAASIDLNDRMTGRMYLIPEIAFEDETNEIIVALKENKQRLGSQSIVLKDDTAPSAPLVKNWLTDYDRTFGPEKQTSLQQQQYLAQNPNVKTLTEQEKNILLSLLQFYDNLKPIPAETFEKYLAMAEGEEVPPTLKQPTTPIPPSFGAPASTPTPPPAPSQASSPPIQVSPPQTAPPPTPPSSPPMPAPRRDAYREPITEDDLTGPQKSSPRPTPRISGNIIDLKDLEQR
jgi:hypothetical protein